MAQSARKNLQLTLLLLLLAGCRTRMLEPVVPDSGSAAVDLAFALPADLAFTPMPDLSLRVSVDLANSCGGAPCPGGEICVFVNRGDCSSFICAKPPAQCTTNISCACLGTSVCPAPNGNGNETFTCMPAPPGVGAIECRSNILCV